MEVKVAQSSPTLYNPMDYAVHGILQARILEWVAFPFSMGSSQLRYLPGLPHCRQILYQMSHKGNPRKWEQVFLIAQLVKAAFLIAQLVKKKSTCNAGDPSLISGLGRSSGEGIGYPLQYSWASLVAQLVKNLPA